MVNERVRNLTPAEAAWFVLQPFLSSDGGARVYINTNSTQRPKSILRVLAPAAGSVVVDLALPTRVMIAIFERHAVEERRGDKHGHEVGAHGCFRATAALLRDWVHRVRPLTKADQQQLVSWFQRECKHWLQDCLTARFLKTWVHGDDDLWDDPAPTFDYFSADDLPFGINNFGERCNTIDECVGNGFNGCRIACPSCDGSPCVYRELTRRWIRHEPGATPTTRQRYLEAVAELGRLAELLEVALPGVDAQTQTDLEKGDAPYEPWHCWSFYHQERQYELDEALSAALEAVRAARERHRNAGPL